MQGLTANDASTTLADAGTSILQARQQSSVQDMAKSIAGPHSKGGINNLGRRRRIHPARAAAQQHSSSQIWPRQLQGLTANDASATLAEAGTSILQARQQQQQQAKYQQLLCRT
jgi:hypothetical protein